MDNSFPSSSRPGTASRYFESVTSADNSDGLSQLQYPVLPSTKKPSAPLHAVVDPISVHSAEEAEQTQRLFVESKNAVLSLLDSTQAMIRDMLDRSPVAFLRYPLPPPESSASSSSSSPVAEKSPASVDDLTSSVAAVAPFRVLRVDIRQPGQKFGSDVLHSLNDASRGQLLANRMQESIRHMDKLRNRVDDTFSKVLITGDLNSGKSTFINSLLRRDILPYDQQPCTTMFCEVMSAKANHDEECVHGIPDPSAYDVDHLKTYSKFDLSHIKDALTQEETDQYRLWKVYAHDNHGFLSDGVVDVVLIDSPGLNRDFTQTMAVFSQHEEIDAVIFVVNAENHFTLSGVEFLGEASKEKPHMFVVVNRFDVIADKERCRENILKQVDELLPKTAEVSSELVHFISAREFLRKKVTGETATEQPSQYDDAFANLEVCLRTFLLEKRTRTKLLPAKMFISNILNDIERIISYNSKLAEKEYADVNGALELTVPRYSELVKFSEKFGKRTEKSISDSLQLVQLNSQKLVDKFIADTDAIAKEIPYHGLLQLWNYADAIVRHMNAKMQAEFDRHENEIFSSIDGTVRQLYQTAAESIEEWPEYAGTMEKYLPAPPPGIVDIRDQHVIRVNIEAADFIEITPGMQTAGIGFAAVSLVGSGVIGYRRIASSIMHLSSFAGTENISRVFWGTIALVGAGTVAFILHDAPNTVQRRIARKVRRHVRKSDKIYNRLHLTGNRTRKTLEQSTFEFKKSVARIVEVKEAECNELSRRKLEVSRNREYFQSVKLRADGLLAAVERVHIDDYVSDNKRGNIIQRK